MHGLWFRVQFMSVLAKRLESHGYRVHPFNYRTTGVPIERNARRLELFMQRNLPDGAHLVGHSLGGLLTLNMLALGGWDAAGRVLFMGTPLQGSSVARRAKDWPLVGRLFGHAEGALETGHPSIPDDRECGMIAGSQGMGLGRLTGRLEKPNDGTVTVAETRHPSLTDHVLLPVTHSGMIYSRQASEQAAAFLSQGRFNH